MNEGRRRRGAGNEYGMNRCGSLSSFTLNPSPSPPQAEPKYLQGLRIQDPDKRLRHIVGMCGHKRMDEATGAPQPAYKFDGMKIMMEFPKPKNEDEGPETGERKQVRGRGGRGGGGDEGSEMGKHKQVGD